MTNVKRTLFIFAALASGALYISTTAQVNGAVSSQTESPSTNLDFSLDVTSGDAPLEVNVAVTEHPEGGGWSYSWIFNDGPVVEGDSATHVYDEPAENNITLLAERNGEVRTATHIVNVTGGTPEVVQVPFTWNKEVFPDAFEVLGLAGKAYLDSATTIPAYSLLNGTTPVIFFDRDGEVVTYDTFIPGIKEYYTLEPEDNIRTEVYNVWINFLVPDADLPHLYTLIDQHPRFSELVEIVREAKRFSPDAEENHLEIVEDIAVDVARAYYQPSSKDTEGGEVE